MNTNARIYFTSAKHTFLSNKYHFPLSPHLLAPHALSSAPHTFMLHLLLPSFMSAVAAVVQIVPLYYLASIFENYTLNSHPH